MSYPVYPSTYRHEIRVGDKTITLEIGKFSEQVAAAVLATCGQTVVHTTVALGRPTSLGYFPLSVEFVEKLYSAGIIKGSRWVKRDGRPTDDVILKARVIDRSLRPLFPDGLTNEVQVINTVFSFDGQNDPDMIGLIASSVALSISGIPFEGPLAGLRIGYQKETGSFTVNPTIAESENSDLDLIVSGTANSIVMVEAGANEVSEAVMLEALGLAQQEFATICESIEKIITEAGKPRLDLITSEYRLKEEQMVVLAEKVYTKHSAQLREVVELTGRLQPAHVVELHDQILAELNADLPEDQQLNDKDVAEIWHRLEKRDARSMIIDEGVRPDGRKTDEIRPIWCEVDVFPRTHGSAMFKRGATQAVTVTTLGSPSLGQYLETIEGEEVRHYMHHYNMPPYASGEAGRFGFPKRREIGHGALAERALLPMIPKQEEFPYTIHVVSEIMSSNGSTSQASVCGSTLSLMAAGVPIKRPVAGIAMGLMSDGKRYAILSDIQGLEDHVGDMDFKVAGTTEGITAIQMDIKLTGIAKQILEQALEQARVGRLHILGKMLECLDQPRTQISEYAPKIQQIIIPADRIGELIGPGGKVIKGIIEETGAQVDVEEDAERKVGLVNVFSQDQSKIDHAVKIITGMMREVVIGDEFDGVVTRVESYGAFVEILPGKEGLLHISAISAEFVQDISQHITLGQTVHVRVSEIKEDGKIGLSMLTPEQEAELKATRRAGGERSDRGGDRGSRGGFGGGRGGRSGGRGGRFGGDRGGSRSFDDRRGRGGDRS